MSEPDAGHVAGQLDLHGVPAEIAEVLQDYADQREAIEGVALRLVREAAAARSAHDEELTKAVQLAREVLIPWERIGEAAGVTRQAAWQRWGKR
jgi:hypothetical protein